MIGKAPIRPEELLARVAAPGCGGQALFVGTVRESNEGRRVAAVLYDAFSPLAERELSRIESEAQARFGARVAAAHRVGRLVVGEASLAVAAASVHRAEAFEACRWAVGEIKHRLPIFKREEYADGGAGWLEGHRLEPPSTSSR